jgi:hypothetical protein
MPAALASAGPTSRSFGHFSRASTSASRVTARCTESPASSGSQPQLRAGTAGPGRSSTENVSPARGGDVHCRSSRPRPAVCASATSTSPSGVPAPASATRSAFVEPVAGTTRISRHSPPGRTSAAVSARPDSGGRSRSDHGLPTGPG